MSEKPTRPGLMKFNFGEKVPREETRVDAPLSIPEPPTEPVEPAPIIEAPSVQEHVVRNHDRNVSSDRAFALDMLEALIKQAEAEGISDIQIRTDRFVYVKARNGHSPIPEWGRLSASQVEAVVDLLYENRNQLISRWERECDKRPLHESLVDTRVANFSCEGGPLTASLPCGRMRVQVHLSTSGLGATIRLLREQIMDIHNVGLPEDVVTALKSFVMRRSGLGLVTGPTGSGKSTTLAALIDWLRTNSNRHIVTIEDPVEYTYPDTMMDNGEEVPCPSVITQQEVNTHLTSFAQGLKDALRKSPEVILIGEIRDAETMQICMEAAQTGHLILSTLHTRGADKTLARIANFFPPDKAKAEIENLSECLMFILTQGLIPSNRSKKSLVCCEFLQNLETQTRSAIVKYATGESAALADQLGRKGNRSWDSELKALFDTRAISEESYREHQKKGEDESGSLEK